LIGWLHLMGGVVDPLAKLQTSGILGNAVFLSKEAPKRVSVRRLWGHELASVSSANVVFLDPDHAGSRAKRLTNRHVALAELKH